MRFLVPFSFDGPNLYWEDWIPKDVSISCRLDVNNKKEEYIDRVSLNNKDTSYQIGVNPIIYQFHKGRSTAIKN